MEAVIYNDYDVIRMTHKAKKVNLMEHFWKTLCAGNGKNNGSYFVTSMIRSSPSSLVKLESDSFEEWRSEWPDSMPEVSELQCALR